MGNMNVIITMGGLGSRFKEAGYTTPKYMIEARGKTLFEWSMDSLLDYNQNVNKYVFVVREEDNAREFIEEKFRKYKLSKMEVVELNYLTDGQATTALLGTEKCNENEAVMIYNIDTYVEPYEMRNSDILGEGHIPCFTARGTHWSFVKVNDEGDVVEIKEKQRISENCTLGAYYFSTAKLYKDIYQQYYGEYNKSDVNEKYVAPLYNYMIGKGMKITVSMIESQKVHVLGTPEELNEFINYNSDIV